MAEFDQLIKLAKKQAKEAGFKEAEIKEFLSQAREKK